jgi:hypothetical protein
MQDNLAVAFAYFTVDESLQRLVFENTHHREPENSEFRFGG